MTLLNQPEMSIQYRLMYSLIYLMVIDCLQEGCDVEFGKSHQLGTWINSGEHQSNSAVCVEEREQTNISFLVAICALEKMQCNWISIYVKSFLTLVYIPVAGLLLVPAGFKYWTTFLPTVEWFSITFFGNPTFKTINEFNSVLGSLLNFRLFNLPEVPLEWGSKKISSSRSICANTVEL